MKQQKKFNEFYKKSGYLFWKNKKIFYRNYKKNKNKIFNKLLKLYNLSNNTYKFKLKQLLFLPIYHYIL